MNIFYFDECPVVSAEAQPDKMLVKMPLETAQMLCSATGVRGKRTSQGRRNVGYSTMNKNTKANHKKYRGQGK